MINFEKQLEKPKSQASPAEKVEEHIEIEEIEALYKPIKKILADMRENIEAGQYVAILGDDASGRLPALLFSKILHSIYEKKNLPRLKTLFFAGEDFPGAFTKEAIQHDFIKFLEKEGVIKMAGGKKVLFVTDTISSGGHLQPFTETLRKKGVDFDIITIGISDVAFQEIPAKEKEKEKLLGGKIFWGRLGTPPIYGRHNLSGVRKKHDFSLFAESGRYPRVKLHKARQGVETLSDKLIKWYHREQ